MAWEFVHADSRDYYGYLREYQRFIRENLENRSNVERRYKSMRDVRLHAGALWYKSVCLNAIRDAQGYGVENEDDPDKLVHTIDLHREVRGQEFAIYASVETWKGDKDAPQLANQRSRSREEDRILQMQRIVAIRTLLDSGLREEDSIVDFPDGVVEKWMEGIEDEPMPDVIRASFQEDTTMPGDASRTTRVNKMGIVRQVLASYPRTHPVHAAMRAAMPVERKRGGNRRRYNAPPKVGRAAVVLTAAANVTGGAAMGDYYDQPDEETAGVLSYFIMALLTCVLIAELVHLWYPNSTETVLQYAPWCLRRWGASCSWTMASLLRGGTSYVYTACYPSPKRQYGGLARRVPGALCYLDRCCQSSTYTLCGRCGLGCLYCGALRRHQA